MCGYELICGYVYSVYIYICVSMDIHCFMTTKSK
jgi:hypothetical protein